MKEVCLVHLVRACNGIEPFVDFLDSYRNNPGGIEHDLLIVFKGFERPEHTEAYRKLLAPIPHLSLEISDEGVDITAYFKAFNQFSERYRYFCFLNSFSVILDPEWLKKLHNHVARPGVGLVGATGSWQGWGMKVRNNNLVSVVNSEILLPLAKFEARFWDGVAYIIKGAWRRLIIFPIYFYSFPNYHLRTNAFMISSEKFRKLKFFTIKSKVDAYKFESGKHGLTRQILGLGQQALIVGKDGSDYDMTVWNKSNTLWQSDQQNLLVSDNLTRDYQHGSPERRAFLSYCAWGSEARR